MKVIKVTASAAAIFRFWSILLFAILLPAYTLAAGDQDVQILRQQWQDMQSTWQIQQQNSRSDALQERVLPEEGEPLLPLRAGTSCLSWQRISVKGLEVLPPAQQKAIHEAAPTECISEEKLNQYSRLITEIFLQQGYFHIALQQDDGVGELVWTILPAQVAEIRNTTALNTGNLFPDVLGKEVNIYDLDQGLDQANRLNGHQVEVDLYPLGDNKIAIELSDKTDGDIHGVVGINNRGTGSIGKEQIYTQISLSNPLGFADMLGIYANTTPTDGDDAYSRSGNLYYSVPYGYWTFSAYGGVSAYSREMQLPHYTMNQSGQSWQAVVKAERVISRDAQHISSVYGQVGRSSVTNRLGGEKLKISSSEQTAAVLGVNHTALLPGGMINLNGEYKQGIPLLGADHPQDAGQQNTQFKKISASANWMHRHQIVGQEVQFNHALTGQYALSDLPVIEEIGLTDSSAVRGFRDSYVSGENGVYLRQTVSSTWYAGRVGINPYLGLDAGTARYRSAAAQSVLGGLIGIKAGQANWQLDFSAGKGRQWSRNHAVTTPTQWWLDMNWRF